MKKGIIICIVGIFWFINCFGQEAKQLQQRTDKDFQDFITLFITVNPPFNYKIEISKIGNGKGRLKRLSKDQAKRYLGMSDDDLYVIDVLYNVDTDEAKEIKNDFTPVAHLKFFTDRFIALIYRTKGSGHYDDSSIVNLRIVNFNNKLISELRIGERFTPEEDWTSSVFLDQYHFKVFQYKINYENYNVQDGYIEVKDKEAPKTVVFEADYEISPEGKITKIKEYPKQYLMEDILEYKAYNPDNDDIMNMYNF